VAVLAHELARREVVGLGALDQLGPDRARVQMERLGRLGDLLSIAVHRVEDRVAETPEADLPVRVYTPREARGPMPATVYLHGGGFVIGSIATHDRVCRLLADRADTIVVSVDYRLAPEHPFPAAAEDACEAFEWVHANAGELGIDPRRIAIAGDSAGGNLAAVVAQAMRDRGGPEPIFQLLIYPAVDMTRSFESQRTLSARYFLTETMIDWFLANYLTDVAQQRDPRCSPIVTRELSALPAAHVVTAGFDPLRDEGEAYADALRAAGVPATSRCYDSLIHGFVGMGGLVDAAAHAIDDLAVVLRGALWP
jgi:acetyl esterase